jgi:hypothetical protein
MLKRIFIYAFTFVVVVVTASLVGGTLNYFIANVRARNYSKEWLYLYPESTWLEAIKTSMLFVFLATLMYYAIKKLIQSKYKLSLFKCCGIGFFASLFGFLFPFVTTGYGLGGFNSKVWINLLVIRVFEGCAIAISATLLKNAFARFYRKPS